MTSFDETDLNSYYFQGVKHEQAMSILMDENNGVFLVRDSSSRGGYVICVKENNTVMEYLVSTHSSGKLFIRPEYHFKDLPAVLSFYKKNMFTSTALNRPVYKEKVLLHLHQFVSEENVSDRRTIAAQSFQQQHINLPVNSRVSAPPVSTRHGDTLPPLYAKVIKDKTPIGHSAESLILRVGGIIQVTRRSNGIGYGEDLSTGKKGNFPLTHVEIIKDFEKSPNSNS